MDLIIRKYNPLKDFHAVRAVIESEGEEWSEYLDEKYELSLKNSITFIAELEGVLCGYSRSIADPGFFVWIVDLLVHKD